MNIDLNLVTKEFQRGLTDGQSATRLKALQALTEINRFTNAPCRAYWSGFLCGITANQVSPCIDEETLGKLPPF